MPAYNAQETIAEAIESVLFQSYRNWELIIINDKSTDDTGAISEYFRERDNRIILINLKHKVVVSDARNTGLQKAKGEFIAFLDSDDLWESSKLETQVFFHLKTKMRISHTNLTRFNEKGIMKTSSLNYLLLAFSKKSGNLYPNICYRNRLGMLTVMLEKSLAEEVNGFNNHIDNEVYLWIKIARKGYKFGYIDKKLARYRVSKNNLTHQIGRCKRIRKRLIFELSDPSYSLNASLLWKYYYRYFGTMHRSSQNYKLAVLYYIKSVKYCPFHYITVFALLYLCSAGVRYILTKFFINDRLNNNAGFKWQQ